MILSLLIFIFADQQRLSSKSRKRKEPSKNTNNNDNKEQCSSTDSEDSLAEDSDHFFEFTDLSEPEDRGFDFEEEENGSTFESADDVDWETARPGNAHAEPYKEKLERIQSSDAEFSPFLIGRQFLSILLNVFFPLMSSLHKDSIRALFGIEEKQRGSKSRSERRSDRINKDSNQEERRKISKSARKSPVKMEKMKKSIKSRYGIDVQEAPKLKFFIRLIGSLLIIISKPGVRHLKERVEFLKEKFSGLSRLYRSKTLRAHLKLLFCPVVHGDQVCTNIIERLSSNFNNYFWSYLRTRGLHYDELLLPTKTKMFPHRFRLTVNKPNTIGMFIHEATYFSGVVCYLRPRYRNRWRRTTPEWARYLDEKYKSPAESKITHALLFDNLIENLRYPSDLFLVMDRFYSSNSTVSVLASHGVDFLIHGKKTTLKSQFDRLQSLNKNRNDTVLQASINNHCVQLLNTDPILNQNHNENQSEEKRTSARIISAGSAMDLDPTEIGEFYTSITRYCDTANGVVSQLMPSIRLNWCSKFFILVLLFSTFNLWKKYRFRLAQLKKKFPKSKFLKRVTPLSFHFYVEAVGFSLLGKRSPQYSRFASKIPPKYRNFFSDNVFAESNSYNPCTLCNPRCSNHVDTYCKRCKKRTCIVGLLTHTCVSVNDN